MRRGLLFASLMALVLIGLAPRTAWASDVIVDVRSDFIPGAEVARVITQMRNLEGFGRPFGDVNILATADLLSGVRVASFVPAFTNEVVDIEVWLLRPNGTIIAIGSVTFFNDDVTKAVTLHITRSGGRLASENEYWTTPTSDEVPFGVRCAEGFAADGMKCRGHFCDNVGLHCRRLGVPQDGLSTDAVNGDPGIGSCAPDGFMDGLACSASFCSDIILTCREASGGLTLDCYQSPVVTDDVPFRSTDPVSFFQDFPHDGNHYVTSMQCDGDFCDDKTLSLCRPGFEVVTTMTVDTRCIASDPGGGGLITQCPTESEMISGDPDKFFVVQPDGRLAAQLGTECFGVDGALQSGAPIALEPCGGAETWTVDAWNRLRLSEEPSFCLSHTGAGSGNGGEAQGDEALELAPCKQAPPWFLQTQPPELLDPPPAIFFSEVVEGSGEGKALEIFNHGDEPVDLADYEVHVYPSETGTLDGILPLSGLLGAGQAFVVVRDDPGTPPELAARADLLVDGLAFDGNDPIELYSVPENRSVDVFGQRFVQIPAFSDANATARDRTLRRKSTSCTGDVIATDPFAPSEEWVELPVDTIEGLGEHSVYCALAQAPIPSSARGAIALALALIGRRLARRRR